MTWKLPGLGLVTSPFGPRNLVGAVSNFHYGTDLGTKRSSVYAAQSGVVRTIWQTAKGAWVVDIRHPDENNQQIRTRYIHMYRNEIVVSVGQSVGAGQKIGNSGASGTGAAHLHFETMINGVNVDPEPFMRARGIVLGVTSTTNPGGEAPTVPEVPPIDPVEPIFEKDYDMPEMIYQATSASPDGLINAGWSYIQDADGTLRALTSAEFGARTWAYKAATGKDYPIVGWAGADLGNLAISCGLREYTGSQATGPLGLTGRIIGRNAPYTPGSAYGSNNRLFPTTRSES